MHSVCTDCVCPGAGNPSFQTLAPSSGSPRVPDVPAQSSPLFKISFLSLCRLVCPTVSSPSPHPKSAQCTLAFVANV